MTNRERCTLQLSGLRYFNFDEQNYTSLLNFSGGQQKLQKGHFILDSWTCSKKTLLRWCPRRILKLGENKLINK